MQVSLCKTLGACICAPDAQPELSCGGALRTTSALQGCDFPAGAARSTLHVLRLLCLSRSCRGPGAQGGIEPATARLQKQARKPSREIKTHGRASTRRIPAEGSRGLKRIRAAPQRKRVDTHHPHRGFIRAPQNRKNDTSFCTSTTPIPAEGRAGTARIAKHLELLHLDHADPRRGSRGPKRYALGSMHFPLRAWLCALASMHLALCTRLYALVSTHSALCIRLCALGSVHLALCALGSMHLALCTWLYALGSMHLAPCTWLYVFDSAQVTLCKLVRELRREEPFAMLSGNICPTPLKQTKDSKKQKHTLEQMEAQRIPWMGPTN